MSACSSISPRAPCAIASNAASSTPRKKPTARSTTSSPRPTSPRSANSPSATPPTRWKRNSWPRAKASASRSEEHTSELQSLRHLVCRLLLEKKNNAADIGFQAMLRDWGSVMLSRSGGDGWRRREEACRADGEPLDDNEFVFFFFNDTATTEIYTLSLHDALPI